MDFLHGVGGVFLDDRSPLAILVWMVGEGGTYEGLKFASNALYFAETGAP